MCLYPIKAWHPFNIETGVYSVSFSYVKGAEEISIPCGKCVECLMSYSNEWATRCVLEASLYNQNCMITLTYSESDGSVHRRDVQLFVKRLRRALYPLKIRYFGCGEYGSKGGRPHYHIIIFGWFPSDSEVFFVRDGHNVYKSLFVSHIWSSGDWSSVPRKPGFISVDDVTYQSAKYCAKYLQKLSRIPSGSSLPFTFMSLKPGIGLGAFRSEWLESDSVYIDGVQRPIPRYISRKFPRDISEVSERKKLKCKILNYNLAARRSRCRLIFGVDRLWIKS